MGAEPSWVVDGEGSLVGRMEQGELDIIVGGLTANSPWSGSVALTRPYLTVPEDGEQVGHVMAVTAGDGRRLRLPAGRGSRVDHYWPGQ